MTHAAMRSSSCSLDGLDTGFCLLLSPIPKQPAHPKIEIGLLLAGRNTAVKPYNLTGSFATINVTSTVYGNVPATPPSPAPAPAPAPARAPAVAPAPAPAPSPSSDLPCPCALPSGYNASAPDLAGNMNCRNCVKREGCDLLSDGLGCSTATEKQRLWHVGAAWHSAVSCTCFVAVMT